MLSLEPEKKNQEGRHRAIAVKEMGLKQVPVQIIESIPKEPLTEPEKGEGEEKIAPEKAPETKPPEAVESEKPKPERKEPWEMT